MQKDRQIYCDPNQDRSEQERHLEEAYKEAKERTIRQLIAMILALIVSAVIYAVIQYFKMHWCNLKRGNQISGYLFMSILSRYFLHKILSERE